jgi:hypothetical protein
MKKLSIFVLMLAAALLISFQRATTTLKVMVIDNLGKIQQDARVRLYNTKEDYEKDQNFISELMTNSKGNAEFINLIAKPYFISAVKGDKDNSSNAVITDTLKDDRLNKIKLIISD